MQHTPATVSPIGHLELVEAPSFGVAPVKAPRPSPFRRLFPNLFRRIDAADLLREQHFQARRLAVAHAAEAERHAALAAMYAGQSMRVAALLEEVQ